MNERIRALREESLNAVPRISPERARLITEFYRSAEARRVSAPMRRALAFRHVLAHKTIWIGDGELIVGERGPVPKATPTYPEVTAHSLEDLQILDSRPKIPYRVDAETLRIYRDEILPFWQGATQRDRLFEGMTPEWRAAFDAGVFTEFMEQRAPGHTVLDDKIYRKGMRDIQTEIDARLAALDFHGDPGAWDKQEELQAMRIAAEAIGIFAERHAARARELAAAASDPARRAELERIAAVCDRVPAHAPRDFHEALQAYWFVHLGVITELNPWDAFNPGRLDQHLWPFYRQGLADGTLTEADARELLQAFWIKFNNQPAPPKVGVTAEESGTYTDFANINLGGLTSDGGDGVNDLTFILLDVIEEMRLLQPSSNIQLSRKSPDAFLLRALKILQTGFGQPSIFNADTIVQELTRQGKSLVDARCGGASGCVEAGAFGKEAYILTGYFNLPKILEITLHDGVDPNTGIRLGPSTGAAATLADFDALMAAFERQVRHFVDVKIRGSNVIERLFAEHLPVPFLSILIDDCVARGRDYHDGGARYDTSYIQGVGIGTITDSLSAIRTHVFERRTLDMAGLMELLRTDFAGRDDLRLLLAEKTPRYGNDDDAADTVMRRVFDLYVRAVDGRPNTRGGTYRVDMLPTTCHVYFGRVTGATPDGRKARQPLSEGISPVQGADRRGPTAVVRSAAKMDHQRTGGTLLNQKFLPSLMAEETGRRKVAQLVRGYFRMDGHHIQFNVVDAATLRDAQVHPERYRDLIVRVAGYSDYFVDLNPALQEEIITRTAHGDV